MTPDIIQVQIPLLSIVTQYVPASERKIPFKFLMVDSNAKTEAGRLT